MKDLPAHQRPREKLQAQGPGVLSDAELLALLLRTGYRGTGVLALAQAVLDAFGGFAGLLKAGPEGFAKVKGLGPAKRSELQAVMEMARRALAQQLQAAPVFTEPRALKDFAAAQLAHLPYESFLGIFLDAQLRLLRCEELFRGTLNSAPVFPRQVARRALELNAAAVVVAHNHPSGVAEPSRADEAITRHLREALQLLEVRLLDHLVVGQGKVVSLAERGLL